MNKTSYVVTKKDLFDLFERLSKTCRVVVPYKSGEHLSLGDYDPLKESSIELGGIRGSQPIKSFLNPTRENVSGEVRTAKRPTVLAGIKGCDLSSLDLQDFVFKSKDLEDPFYAGRRNNTTIIGCDCTYAKETCFCLAMDGAPYPRKHFDLALSPIGDFFVVGVESSKGASLIEGFSMFFKEAQAGDIRKRDEAREEVSEKVRGYIERRRTPGTSEIKGCVKKNYNNDKLWQDSSSTCVECGACNLVCPTCHCFLLFDGTKDARHGRFRVWDSCLYKTFASVAGGANPRRHLYERLRNRFDKKFDFFPHVLGLFACTGCGRCIEACPGDIDIREVLKGVVHGNWNSPPHK